VPPTITGAEQLSGRKWQIVATDSALGSLTFGFALYGAGRLFGTYRSTLTLPTTAGAMPSSLSLILT
jgi:hypothetical protein